MATKTVQIESLPNYSSVTAGQHQLTIIAYGSGYANSAPTTAITYTKLATVTNELINDSTYSFTASANASEYDIYATNTLLGTTSTNSVDLTTLTGYASLPTGTYTIRAISKASGLYTQSNISTGVSYTKVIPQLDAPLLSITNDNATIAQTDENAEQYGLYVNGVRQATIPLPTLQAPATPTASGTTISFAEVEGADSYEVFANGTSIGTYTPPVVQLISFNIQWASTPHIFNAEEGMTWAQWCASAYNTDGFTVGDGQINAPNDYAVVHYEGHIILPSDMIVNERVYGLQYGG